MKPVWLSSAKLWITGGLFLAWNIPMSELLTTKAQAEWYVGGYVGVAAPGGLSNTTVGGDCLRLWKNHTQRQRNCNRAVVVFVGILDANSDGRRKNTNRIYTAN